VTTFSSGRATRTLPFLLLAAAEVLIVFRNAGHFFNPDTLFWMWNRYHTLQEFVVGFFQRDPALWYRPLSQRTLESLLFPLAGLNPIPYRIVGFLLFFACTLAVFLLAHQLTHRRRAAWLAVLLFAPQVILRFVAYDVAFTPDLFLMLFSVGSAVAYMAHLRQPKRATLVLSLLLFAGALLSKETATGIPFALLALWFFLRRDARVSAASLAPHFTILAIYLVFAFAILHVRDLQMGHLLGWLSQDPTSEYRFEASENVRQNVADAFAWTFGIPSGVHGQWPFDAAWILPVLKSIRVLASFGALVLLFTSRRNIVLIGGSWFIALLAPALLLKTHFLPYYLFVPLAGTAVAGGAITDWLYERCEKFSPIAGTTVVLILLGVWTKGQVHAGNRVVLTHPLLGGAANPSGIAWQDVHRAYPTLPKGQELVFLNEGLPSAPADQGFGTLFKLAYDDPSLVIHYSTTGLPPDLNVEEALVFQWMRGHFVDVTSHMRRRPESLWKHREPAVAADGAPRD
jgi:hypothetical protein